MHPYNKTAAEAEALLDQYRAITTGLSLWVTEWNRPAGYIPAFKNTLRINTAMDAFFCWSSGMVVGFGFAPEQGRALRAAA